MEIKNFLIKGMVPELQSAEFADFSKLRHPSWSTTAELEASVEPRIDVIVGTHVCQSHASHTHNCNRDFRKAINNASEVYPANMWDHSRQGEMYSVA